MKKDPTDIVREGYDRIAEQYDDDIYRSHFSDDAELDGFMSLVKPGGHVLDAGCGSGRRVARVLVDNGFQVTGIDISQKMIDLAKLKFEEDSFDGIVSTYAVFHVPRTKHFSLFQDFHCLLKKGGALLFSVGSRVDGTDGTWD